MLCHKWSFHRLTSIIISMNQLGNSQSLTDIMKPQRTSASKPGLELQILCPCLLASSAVFKILIKALFKLRRLWKYIGQSLFTFIFIQPLFTQQQPVFPQLLKMCISILPICTRCIPVAPSHLFILVDKYMNDLLQIQLNCINSLEHCCFFITCVHQHKTSQKSVVLLKKGEVRKV